MLNDFFAKGSGPYLAVIDGRFLPVDELSVDVQHDLNRQVQGIGGTAITQKGKSEMLLSMTTRRDPMIRNHHELTQRVFLFNQEQKLVLSNFSDSTYGLSFEFGNSYELEFSALDWEIEDR